MPITATTIRDLEAEHDVPHLIEALTSADAAIRRDAAEALGSLCDDCLAMTLGRPCHPCAYGPLCDAAEDRALEVCEAAIAALEKIRQPLTLGVP